MSETGQSREYTVRLKRPHPKQLSFIRDKVKRKVVRAGRRGGKTTGVGILAVEGFLAGKRVLYAAPTIDQVSRFWGEVKNALIEPIDAGVYVKNETNHTVIIPGTKIRINSEFASEEEKDGIETRIKAKTAWNADTLRGDYADLLILDEFQLMNEDAWELVGVPMLLDNNGDAVFIYTPPSFHSASATKARDPRHAPKLFKKAAADQTGRWRTYHFSSHDNPHLSRAALDEITMDMTALAMRQEIQAEDIDEIPGAMWTREMIDRGRVSQVPDELWKIVVGIDPPGGATECGNVIVGIGPYLVGTTMEAHLFVIGDYSGKGSPDWWSKRVKDAYDDFQANLVVGEKNFGGDMVKHTITTVDPSMPYQDVSASRGKAVRAEPIAALYEQGRVHHVGVFPQLEDEMCSWVPGMSAESPNRMDALVWAATDLAAGVTGRGRVDVDDSAGQQRATAEYLN